MGTNGALPLQRIMLINTALIQTPVMNLFIDGARQVYYNVLYNSGAWGEARMCFVHGNHSRDKQEIKEIYFNFTFFFFVFL